MLLRSYTTEQCEYGIHRGAVTFSASMPANAIDWHWNTTKYKSQKPPNPRDDAKQQIRNENGTAPFHSIQRKIRNTPIGICTYPKFRVMGTIHLFELEVGESDFVELRRDQALLVDFHNFAHSFVSL
mmetsp:Transcript_17366/g.24740  ORF Transcript_17366/g.24740 Transcript_17366/m.24740 type:complete len:127 (-) Transcript_17366:96-476(-)